MKKNGRKEADYFEYFRISTEYACKAARVLDETLRCFNKEEFSKRVEQMHEIEHAADANRHEMIESLAREFLPPIEREDIVDLAQQLDNVVDSIDDVLLRAYMFDIDEIRPDALELSALIVSCCDSLHEAVTEFRHFRSSKSLKIMLVTVNTLESDGDSLYTESVHRLFCENTDARTTLAWMKIFDVLEDCLDACEDAADIIENVMMKNS